jgi:hypothetical protein
MRLSRKLSKKGKPFLKFRLQGREVRAEAVDEGREGLPSSDSAIPTGHWRLSPPALLPQAFAARIVEEILLAAHTGVSSAMKRKSLLAGLIALLLVGPGRMAWCQQAPPAAADRAAAATESKFIRVQRDASKRPISMETAVIRYVSADGSKPGLAVDLIGAVHVGDAAYYEELNKLFESYDVVLYELVAPEGTRIPKEGRQGASAHPVGALQDGMSTLLELKHQLDLIDYTKENLVHADMSPEEFAKTMADRGESFVQMFLRLMGQGMAQNAGGGAGANDLGLLMALFSRDRATALKTIMAEQFENLEGQLAVLDGPEGSTIITERNKKAFDVLAKQLEAGKTKIGVFYGAGHLPDMERRLIADFGLKRDSEQWLSAWQLARRGAKAAEPAGNEQPAVK